nr:ATP-binding protein [uncultured Pseudodesulfovibrio sp.]
MTITGAELFTHYASPQRDSKESIRHISNGLTQEPMLSWFDAVPMGMTVVNRNRQIVHCNKAFEQLVLKPRREDIIGLRPGEALNCVNSQLVKAGCGCSEFCNTCGAAQAIIKSLEGTSDCKECRMIRLVHDSEEPLDLQIYTKPIEFEGEPMTVVFTMDISHELKLRYFNRTFHHGLINGVGGIASLTELIEADPNDSGLYQLLIEASQRTLRDVLYSRDVTAAEEGRLTPGFETFEAKPFFETTIAKECALRNMQNTGVDIHVSVKTLTSDKRLLGHALRNMLSNALEASESSSDEITLKCKQWDDERSAITMTNSGEIPSIIRKQMFKRYISTKSRDRGLGNYVTKLLTEKYLQGEVRFSSDNGMTSFTLLLPASPKN